MSKEKLVGEIREKAHFYDQYSGCSQSVLFALQEGLEIGDLESFKAATVLSGGVARRGGNLRCAHRWPHGLGACQGPGEDPRH